MNSNVVVVVISLLVLTNCVLLVAFLVKLSELRYVRGQFTKYMQYHNQFIALYLTAAKSARNLTIHIYKLNYAITSSVFKPFNLNVRQIAEWRKTYNLPDGKDSCPPINDFCEDTIKEYLKKDENERKFFCQNINSNLL